VGREISGKRPKWQLRGCTHWPQGDSGRCETTTADTVENSLNIDQSAEPETHTDNTVAAQDNMGAVCHPKDTIANLYNTVRHSDYVYWEEKCAAKANEAKCEGDVPEKHYCAPDLGPLDTSVVAKSQGIADCKKAVAVTYDALRACMHENVRVVGRHGANPKTYRRCFEGNEHGMTNYIYCSKQTSTDDLTGHVNVCSREAEVIAFASCK
jgi:hypothetical protein